MQTISFQRTANFWLDNGIIGLYRILMALFSDDRQTGSDLDIKLTPNALIVTANDLTKVMNAALGLVTEHYLYVKDDNNFGWMYVQDKNRFETYVKKNWALHLKGFFKGKTPETEGGLLTKEAAKALKEKGKSLSRKKAVMSDSQEVAFHKFLEANNLYIPKKGDKKEKGKIKISGEGVLNTSPVYELKDKFELQMNDEGRALCLLSGVFVKSAKKMAGTNYPFVTGESGEINFASNLSAELAMSSLFAFVSMFSHYNLFYSGQDEAWNYFALFDTNLESLNDFYTHLLNKSEETDEKRKIWCNFKKAIMVTNYPNETLLNFLLSAYTHIDRELYRDKMLTKTVYSFAHDGSIFQSVREFSKIDPLFRLFDKLQEQGLTKERVLPWLFGCFKRVQLKHGKPQDDTFYRESFSSRILDFTDLYDVIEEFLFEVGLREDERKKVNHSIPNWALNIFIKTYYLEVLNMDKQMLDRCVSLGMRIGNLCKADGEKGNRDVLYRLRNAKNLNEFLAVLEFAQYKLEGKSYSYDSGGKTHKIENLSIGKPFIENLDENSWERYKSLVSIFAMNAFLGKVEGD